MVRRRYHLYWVKDVNIDHGHYNRDPCPKYDRKYDTKNRIYRHLITVNWPPYSYINRFLPTKKCTLYLCWPVEYGARCREIEETCPTCRAGNPLFSYDTASCLLIQAAALVFYGHANILNIYVNLSKHETLCRNVSHCI